MALETAHSGGVTPPELPEGYEHGTTRAYAHCRPACVQCKAANSAAAAARRAKKLAEGMPVSAHGAPSGYTFWGCRCKRCKMVARTSSKTRTRVPRVKPDLEIMPEQDHGTRRGYVHWDCPSRTRISRDLGEADEVVVWAPLKITGRSWLV